jgi:hypothetical protein
VKEASVASIFGSLAKTSVEVVNFSPQTALSGENGFCLGIHESAPVFHPRKFAGRE